MPSGGDRSAADAPEAATRLRTCFVVSPIGEPESDTRVRSDKVLKHIIRKALEPTYKVERADELNLPGTISVQVVERVFEADLVVADLSEQNPNVYYELAIRHATRRPSVHIVASGQKLPFDINQIRAVQFDITDPDSIEEAQRRLKEQVSAIEAGEGVVTPVQIAQSLTSLNTGEDRDKQILEVLQGLTAGISRTREDLFSAANQIVAALWNSSVYRPNAGWIAGGMPPNVSVFGTPNTPPTIGPENTKSASGFESIGARMAFPPGRRYRRVASRAPEPPTRSEDDEGAGG